MVPKTSHTPEKSCDLIQTGINKEKNHHCRLIHSDWCCFLKREDWVSLHGDERHFTPVCLMPSPLLGKSHIFL